MRISSLHRVAEIVLTVLVFAGLPASGNRLQAEGPKSVPVPTDELPQGGEAAQVDKPVSDKPVMVEKVAEGQAEKKFDVRALVAPIQELFGLGGDVAADEEVMIEGGPGASNIPPVVGEDNPMAMQFIQMNQSKLKAELRFVRLICSDLTPDQRPKVRIAAEQSLKQYANRMANQQNQMQRGVPVNQNNRDPVQLIREAIAKVLKESLSEDQLTSFRNELDKRVANRKRSVILYLVSLIDSKLFLDQEQRGKIEQTLSTRWQDDWEKWSMYSQFGGQYLPLVPDDCVSFCLNSEQKTVWNGLQKVEFGWWDNDGQGFNQDDDQWWGIDVNGEQPNEALNQLRGGIVVPDLNN